MQGDGRQGLPFLFIRDHDQEAAVSSNDHHPLRSGIEVTLLRKAHDLFNGGKIESSESSPMFQVVSITIFVRLFCEIKNLDIFVSFFCHRTPEHHARLSCASRACCGSAQKNEARDTEVVMPAYLAHRLVFRAIH